MMDTIASYADGIAGTLLSHPPAPAAVLMTVREALIAEGVAYVKTRYGSTIPQIGIGDETIATRLRNDVHGAVLSVPGGVDKLQAGILTTPEELPQAVGALAMTALTALTALTGSQASPRP